MPTKPVSIPHIAWRDGRPRFSPGRFLRAAGHKGRDLRHADGRWFTRGEAIDWSDAFVKSLADAARKSRGRAKVGVPARRPAPVTYPLGRLVEDWRRSAKFQLPKEPRELMRQRRAHLVYSPKTVKDYFQKIGVLEQDAPDLWAAPTEAIETPHIVGLYEELRGSRGLATARGVVAVLSVAFSWGRRHGKPGCKVNPALDVGMSQAPRRERFGSRAEIAALIAAADWLGWLDMGDMVALGVWTGQRQEDRLLLDDKGLVNGRRIFRQGKTGAIVALREPPELAARLRAAADRRRAAGVLHPRVVLDEQAWAPFPDDGDRYRKRFATLRLVAGGGIMTGFRAVCPSLLGDAAEGVLQFQEADLRSTAVVWLALAGATIPEICAITGHSLASATTILRHYLVLHPEMADSGLGKMIAWYEGGSEAETGL